MNLAVNMYNSIYKVITKDKELLELIGLNISSSNEEKSKVFNKRARPQNLDFNNTNKAIISFYTPDGDWENENTYVYESIFAFDVYTKDDIKLAHEITNRITELFHDKFNTYKEANSYRSRWLRSHESISSEVNTYCFTSLFAMSSSE